MSGRVTHRRLGPLAHGFRYGLYMHRLDLAELPVIDRQLRLLGINRWRPSAFYEADHLRGPGSLRERVTARLVAHGVTTAIARIELLTQCRVFGYVFNPVSFFFCYDHEASLVAIVAEVNNTFGETHCYVLPAQASAHDLVDGGDAAARVWHDKKVFHVSPFMTLDGTYRFQFTVSDAHADVRIDLHRDGAPVFVSRLSLDRRPLSDRTLAVLLARYPLAPLRVIGAIHWEALRLWWKGATYHPKPPYAPDTVSKRTSG